ncbi:MAG: thiamine diphosphokinase [Actinobacteria bacterium]|nr:thiamine diphosphokinase [Actinomycetota bacterium]
MTPEVRRAVVVTGGDPIDPASAAGLGPGSYVIAADSGLDRAMELGLDVDLAVGDFDSVSPGSLAAAATAGCRIERHPAAKDRTDLELALLAAVDHGATHVLVLGGHGGRLDHLLANALVLAEERFAALSVEAVMGAARLDVVRRGLQLVGPPGELVSLLAVGGPARDVRTEGLRYPLRGEDLYPGSTRGVSNEMSEATATLTVGSGVVLVIRPLRAEPELVG